jgi:hypothetical protein
MPLKIKTNSGKEIEIDESDMPAEVSKVFRSDDKIISKSYTLVLQPKGIGFQLKKHEVIDEAKAQK